MNVRTSLIASVSILATLALPLHSARAQSDQQCSLKTITEALNNLGCVVPGAYISADSLVASITDTCTQTADAETCHACFRKGGGKVGPALKGLVKAKMLSKATLSQFRIALVTAEEATCAAKEAPQDTNNEDDSGDTYAPPTNVGGGASGSRGRGRDDSAGATVQKPERPERPERRR